MKNGQMTRGVKTTAIEKFQSALVITFSVLALQGFLEFFPDGLSSLTKILIGLGGGVAVALYFDRILKAVGVE